MLNVVSATATISAGLTQVSKVAVAPAIHIAASMGTTAQCITPRTFLTPERGCKNDLMLSTPKQLAGASAETNLAGAAPLLALAAARAAYCVAFIAASSNLVRRAALLLTARSVEAKVAHALPTIQGRAHSMS